MDNIASRRSYSLDRIEDLSMKLGKEPELVSHKDLCVYVTGSFGRLEAAPRSDVDVFFLHSGRAAENGLSRVSKALVDAAVITTCRQLHFPEFTKGCLYLDIHHIGDILEHLGSPVDDAKNYFTARMLLLTESKPLVNVERYEAALQTIVESYLRDFHDHEKKFMPVFLVNDVIRYWKTICLNYESRRNRTVDPPDEAKKNKIHVKNFKLKFSRIMTCFSYIAALLHLGTSVTHGKIVEISKLTPIERIELIGRESERCQEVVARLLSEYDWFLERTSGNDGAAEQWLAERGDRNAAFERARGFGAEMYALLSVASDDRDFLRYLVV